MYIYTQKNKNAIFIKISDASDSLIKRQIKVTG